MKKNLQTSISTTKSKIQITVILLTTINIFLLTTAILKKKKKKKEIITGQTHDENNNNSSMSHQEINQNFQHELSTNNIDIKNKNQ